MDVYIVVSGGRVESVYADNPTLCAYVLDLDNAEHESPEAFDAMKALINDIAGENSLIDFEEGVET
jgi:hypothetical protein